MPNYLVVATSGRAIAQSLKTLGNIVVVVDGFADSDTCAATADCIKVKRSQYGLDAQEVQHAVQRLRSKIALNGLFYDAAIESNPSLLDEINVSPVIGNSSQTLKTSKKPKEFFTTLDRHAIPYPEINYQLESISNIGGDWLVKDMRGTGGVGVTPALIDLQEIKKFSSDCYLQKKMDGVNFSITFLANYKEIMELGFNTQWSEKLSDRIPYAYAGAINHVTLDKDIKQIAKQYAQILAKEFKLIGLNSIDFIYAASKVYVLEVNPRIPATYELYESKDGNLMRQHIETCSTGILPKTTKKHLLRAHAIVYAPEDLHVNEDISWPLWTADRPQAGELIKQSEPLCSVFAGGQNSSQVCKMIENRKQSIIEKLTHQNNYLNMKENFNDQCK